MLWLLLLNGKTDETLLLLPLLPVLWLLLWLLLWLVAAVAVDFAVDGDDDNKELGRSRTKTLTSERQRPVTVVVVLPPPLSPKPKNFRAVSIPLLFRPGELFLLMRDVCETPKVLWLVCVCVYILARVVDPPPKNPPPIHRSISLPAAAPRPFSPPSCRPTRFRTGPPFSTAAFSAVVQLHKRKHQPTLCSSNPREQEVAQGSFCGPVGTFPTNFWC